MFGRPRAGETEEDLLSFQESFLSSGESPSASLAGKKRQGPVERDVVQLGDGASGVSPAKRSRFKQRQQVEREPSQTPLAEIRDHDITDKPIAMPTWMTSRGFPSVQQLDWESVARDSETSAKSQNKKKSLFAKQFETHSPEFFGFEFKPTNQTQATDRDKVQPFDLSSSASLPSETPPTSEESARFESTASQTWTNLLGDTDSTHCHAFSSPSLISGAGLEGSGVSREAAAEEVRKIHSENVRRLTEASDGELRRERERVEQVLGPELVAFLKRDKMVLAGKEGDGEMVEGNGVVGEGEMGEGEMGDGEMGEGERERDETGTVVPAAGWVHMEEVEREKIEWMTDVLPTDLQEGGPVRFSLDGLVIPRGTSLPSHSALYHHGDEPAAAGYALMELLSLVRSSVPQQRVLSLTTLSKIMDKAWRGGYNEVVSHGVLQALCSTGLPLLLRYAVDDSSTAVISAALSALHSLLVPRWEEHLLQELCGCHRGTSVPCAGHPLGKKRGEGDSGEEGDKEQDSEIMDRDVVQGYLVTGLLLRLRYILEVVRPGAAEVEMTLEIILRLARHSLQAATEVVECPRLMNAVFSEFLPLVWSPAEEGVTSTPYGQPQPAAMRLVQVLVSASRNLSSLLLSRHGLLEVIVRYTLPRPSELHLPGNSAHSLSLAALQTGRDLLLYGLATSWISDCYPVLSRHFFSLPSLSLSSLPLHEAAHLASLISLLEPAISFSPPSLSSSLLPPLLSSLSSWVREGENDLEIVAERLVCLRAILHVVASYLLSTSSPEGGSMERSELAASLSSPSGLLETLSHSSILHTALSGIRETSLLCHPSPSSHPHPSQLPSLHPSLPPSHTPAVHGGQYENDITPILRPNLVYISSIDFLLGYLRLCLAAGSAHRGVVSAVSKLLENSDFKKYLGLVCEAAPVKYSCAVFGEFQLLHTTVQLFMMKVTAGVDVTDGDLRLYHRLSLHLLSLLPPGMEGAIENLLSSTIFHPALFHELTSTPGSLLEEDLSSLSMVHPPQPLTPSHPHTITPSLSSLLATIRDQLPSITSSLLSFITTTFNTKQRSDTSRQLFMGPPNSTPLNTLRCPIYTNPLLPADWQTLPLVSLYQQSSSRRSRDQGSEVTVTVRNSLSVQLLLEKLRPSCLSFLPPSSRFSRTILTFLIGNDIFLEREIRPLLSVLLSNVYCSHSIQQVMDFSLPLPGLPSFHDLYQSLLTQYAAVSYGDPLFSCYLLLPLQRRFPASLRRCVWDQHSHTLRLLSLPLDQLPVKLDSFLSPPETDHQLLDLYMGALATGAVQPQWSPLFYLTAVHHVHHFFSKTEEMGPDDAVLRDKLLQAVQRIRSRETREHIEQYAGPTGEGGLGFNVSETPPVTT